MNQIQQQYAQLTPIREFSWYFDHLSLYNGQQDIIDTIIEDRTLSRFPPCPEYRFSFLKMLISKLESVLDGDEMVRVFCLGCAVGITA